MKSTTLLRVVALAASLTVPVVIGVAGTSAGAQQGTSPSTTQLDLSGGTGSSTPTTQLNLGGGADSTTTTQLNLGGAAPNRVDAGGGGTADRGGAIPLTGVALAGGLVIATGAAACRMRRDLELDTGPGAGTDR